MAHDVLRVVQARPETVLVDPMRSETDGDAKGVYVLGVVILFMHTSTNSQFVFQSMHS